VTAARKTLDPKLDIVFWMLFGEERNRALLISLLNAVLQPRVPIEAVEVLPSELEKSTVVDKAIVLDVRVRLANSEQVDIEMQSQRRPALPQRVLYYWARLYTGQLTRGHDYASLRRCVVVVFSSFCLLTGSRFHSIFQVREAGEGVLLAEQLELHFVELPKLTNAIPGDEPNLTLWGRFLSATTDAQLEALSMEHPVFKEAKRALEDLSADPQARELAEWRETKELFDQWERRYEKELSREEGKAEGKAEAKAVILTRLLTLKFGELPDSVVRRITAGSEAELDRWLERLLSAAGLDDVLNEV
jgi:predicted transposase/invertase (TIGR01784 family)